MKVSERRKKLRELAESLNGVECKYGVNDCSMFPAQWISDISGKELDIPFYDSRAAGNKLINEAGGLVNIWAGILGLAGFTERFDQPEFGDIGIMETRAFGEVGIIFCDCGLALWRSENGTAIISPRQKTILKVWAI